MTHHLWVCVLEGQNLHASDRNGKPVPCVLEKNPLTACVKVFLIPM